MKQIVFKKNIIANSKDQTGENIKIPPCQNACPLKQDVRGYIYLIAQNRLNDAARLIRETNPLPGICGLICAHPCEDECRRDSVDQSLSIRRLKRYVMENAPNPYEPIETNPSNGMKIAIIGSGPAGLTAAHDLAIKGYQVTVFEHMDDFGGSIRWGVPSYRLPLEVIRKDLQAIEQLGVEFKKNQSLGTDITIDGLENQGFNATILAMGLSESRGLPIPNNDHKDVLTALPFLRAGRANEYFIDESDTVVVIGSGDMAMDVARTAIRQGAKHVRLTCLEQWDEMPASELERREALEEGVQMDHIGWGPKSVQLDNEENISGLECKACIRVFDENGRFAPQYNEENTTIVPANKIIFAIGQYSLLHYLTQMDIKLDQRGLLYIEQDTGMTTREGIFSCGEVVKGPGLAVETMAHARKITAHVDAYLKKVPLVEGPDYEVIEPLEESTTKNIREHRRQKPNTEPVESRITNFRIVEKSLTPDEAIQETKRCLNCGKGAYWNYEACAFCLNCIRVCPYKVPKLDHKETIEINQDQCQACGLCYSLCPAGAIGFRMEDVTQFQTKLRNEAKQITYKKGTKQLILYCYYSQHEIFALQTKIERKAVHTSLIGIPCIGKLKNQHIYDALRYGYDHIRVYGCDEEDCTHPESSIRGRNKVKDIRTVIANMGYSEGKLHFNYISELKNQ